MSDTHSTSPDTPEASSTWRPAIAIGLLTYGAIVLGGLLVPWIYRGMLHLGRTVPSLDGLRGIEFDSLSSRTTLILVVLGLWPAWKWGRLPAVRFGPQRFLRALAIGLLSMSGLIIVGWIFQNYHPEMDPELKRVSEWLEMIIGACLVGFLEEFLFRGIVYNILRKATSTWPATLIAATFFAAVHFAKPEPLVGTVHGAPDAGLRLVESMFYFGHEHWHYVPYCFTLFIMGVLLCRVYERTGSLWYCMGLHAGWVFAMRLGGYLVEVAPVEQAPAWARLLYGPSDVVAKSWAALLLICLFLVVWLLPAKPSSVQDNASPA